MKKCYRSIEIDVGIAIDSLYCALNNYQVRGRGYQAIERALGELRDMWPKEFENRLDQQRYEDAFKEGFVPLNDQQ